MHKNVACIILAAGEGTRMKSDVPKVLHPICGRPMLGYVLDLVEDLKIPKVVAVLGHRHQEVKKFLKPTIKVAIQKKLLGTADAVRAAQAALGAFKGTLLVLYADNPLLQKETIKRLLKHHIENKLDATLLTAKLKNPRDYGRILRDEYSSVCAIVEEKDADDYQRDIKEINTGIICFNKDRLYGALKLIRPNNRKKEYYLTDIVNIFYKKGYFVDGIRIPNINEALGINSRQELAKANKIMQGRINDDLMKQGVTIIDPDSTFVSFGTKIGQDTTIYPFTVIEGDVKIGKRCFIGPFAHLRPGCVLEDEVRVGNFIELVRTRISFKTRVRHFGYLGDSRIGRQVNVGAGTVTANYDGRKKNITVIKDKSFIGCDTVLIAPTKIGKGAKTGAGSVVVRGKGVPDGATVVGVPAKPLRDRHPIRRDK